MSSTSTYVIVPVSGTPYILETYGLTYTKEELVNGEVRELINNENNKTITSPEIAEQSKEWSIIHDFFVRIIQGKSSKRTKVYVNKYGMDECKVNKNILRYRWFGTTGDKNYIYGNLVIEINTKRDAKAIEGLPICELLD